MVGLIHKILVDLMEDMAGQEKVLEVKRRAGIDDGKVFRMNEAYDDEWQRLFSATCAVLRVTQDQAEEAFADFRLSRHRRGPTPMPPDL
ncbi:MAG: heme NO-binding domain-containing protein [Phycisphaerales bacterium]